MYVNCVYEAKINWIGNSSDSDDDDSDSQSSKTTENSIVPGMN